MKNFYILILTFSSLFNFAQVINPQILLDRDWRLVKMTSGTAEYLPPPPVNILESSMEYINNNYYFSPRYYNSGNCLITFTDNENSFTYLYSQIPFIYQGENSEAVNAYDKMMLDFYLLYRGQKYFYDYSAEGNAHFMTITNPAGDKMYFKGMTQLSTSDDKKTVYKIYPNPVENVIKIQSKEKIKSVIITTAEGKQIKKMELLGDNQEINVESLSPGVYYINVNNSKAQKIIKK